jgi:hypothetical protein
MFSLQKIGEECRTSSAQKQRGEGERKEVGVREKDDPNNVCTY